MSSMYDRLGDLLNEALENGSIPQSATADSDTSSSPDTGSTGTAQPEDSPPPAVPADTAAAFKFLGLPVTASLDECRKAYKTKLKRYHPDNNSDNPVVQKVASRKTDELVQAFSTVSAWIKENRRETVKD